MTDREQRSDEFSPDGLAGAWTLSLGIANIIATILELVAPFFDGLLV